MTEDGRETTRQLSSREGYMAGKNPDNSASQRVEQAVSRCETLSVLPAVASRFFSQFGRMELTPSSLCELIESDPALTVLVLRLCHNKGIVIKQGDTWLLGVMEGLTLREIRDAVLSAKICGGLSEDERSNFRKELTLHSLASACCAKELARHVTPAIEGDTAYLAGLLHDIGKFLLDEAMPKSFDTLLEQARTGKMSFCRVEQENLGIDHTILGKRFAQKLRLPGDVILGIWLHHTHSGAISQAMPNARIATIVELADGIVRKAGIGKSGNFDEEIFLEELATPLGLTAEQIKQVEQQLPDIVRQKSEAAGLNLLRPGWAYCDALRETAGRLAEESTKLFEEGARLQINASHYDFVREMLPKVNSTMTSIEMAEAFAVAWQRFYQTGPVCVYLVDQGDAKSIEAIVVEDQTKKTSAVFNVPEDAVLIPQSANGKFAVLDAADDIDWLLEQVEVEFDLTRTKVIPLQTDGRTAGVIIFEMRHPVQGDMAERFEPAARLGAAALDMLETIGRQQRYAERFAQILSGPGFAKMATPWQAPRLDSGQAPDYDIRGRAGSPNTGALAEMAAGAAHEMNNPLSVISGRAQLLARSEADADKKRILEQIQQNAGELSAIIDDLMSYASPANPRATETAVRQIIEEAVALTSQKKNASQLDIKIEIPPDTPNVFVDSAQIASAMSNIICNGLESDESFDFAQDKAETPDKDIPPANKLPGQEGQALRQSSGQAGPIGIKAFADKAGGTVSIQVIDSGRGMDEQTLAKATQPFYSARPAGRKRGMGLAHTQRLIEINRGTLTLASQLGKGTTVTVTLPANSVQRSASS